MAKKPCLSVAVSDEQLGDTAPVPFQGGIIRHLPKVAELGYTGIEIHIRNPETIDGEGIRSACEEAALAVTAVGTGLEYSLNKLSFTSTDIETRARTARAFKKHIDLAALFGAVVFVGLCRGTAPDNRSREEYLERFAAEILPIQQYADEKRVLLVLEPIAYYMTNLLNTTEECLAFLQRPGFQKMELLLDTHHMLLEDPSMEETLVRSRGKIGHLHISDSNRRYPGGGNIDFDGIAEGLKKIDYSAAVSLEVLPFPSGEEAARKGINWMKRHW